MKGDKKKFKMQIERRMPNMLEGIEVYLESKILVRHLKVGSWKMMI